jgi:soluble lytic murein transglycosylase-like protein
VTQGGRRALAVFGFVAVAGLGANARAQVLDIDARGDVTVLRGPIVYTDARARSISTAVEGSTRDLRASFADRPAVRAAAARHGVSPKLLEAVAWRESNLDSHAVSPKGAVGTMQLMPGTARAMGVDPRDPDANLDGGAAYLARSLQAFGGDVTLALAAYNAGPAAVKRYAGVPPFPETRAYVDAILRRLADDVSLESAP